MYIECIRQHLLFRICCEGMLVELKLLKRQDLVKGLT